MSQQIDYDHLLSTISKDQWKRIGINRRSGVVVPLFSVYSSNSTGIGELPDIKLLVDWCVKTGMSIIQFLPINDVGFNFRPYDTESMFALDPMYLAIDKMVSINPAPFQNDLKQLKKDFPTGLDRVNYKVKSAKLNLLWRIFKGSPNGQTQSFKNYCQKNAFWLEDYALFRVIKEKNNGLPWEKWSEDLKDRSGDAISSVKKSHNESLMFHKWLQWQLFEQFKDVKSYAGKKQVFLMGDIPFLVARDSADVWSHQEYFKIALSAGAPPDMLYSRGQRWGMPPYHWENIARHNYDYFIEKLRYAENFYDLYRIDHVVGIFRVWTISLSEPHENAGLNGVFDPKDESAWEEHGRRLLSVMIKNTSMLACAEDLGTVPQCSFKVLEELGIPGIDVQRWMRKWSADYDYKDPSEYRKNAVATIATHDMSCLCAWWRYEAQTVDEGLFKRKCKEKNIGFDLVKDQLFDLKNSFHERLRWKEGVVNKQVFLKILGADESRAKDLLDLYNGSFDEKPKFLKFIGMDEDPKEPFSTLFIKRALEKVSESASIFSCQLLLDWLSLDSIFYGDPWDLRINTPGTLDEKNWTLAMPIPLEDILALPINSVIKSLNLAANRS